MPAAPTNVREVGDRTNSTPTCRHSQEVCPNSDIIRLKATGGDPDLEPPPACYLQRKSVAAASVNAELLRPPFWFRQRGLLSSGTRCHRFASRHSGIGEARRDSSQRARLHVAERRQGVDVPACVEGRGSSQVSEDGLDRISVARVLVLQKSFLTVSVAGPRMSDSPSIPRVLASPTNCALVKGLTGVGVSRVRALHLL